MKILWSPAARADLADIWRYVAADSIGMATVVENRLIDAVEGLSVFPEKGRPCRGGCRELVVAKTSHMIVYRVKPDRIEILRLWHGARGEFG
ncbi:type II toxin-antitoxin system RelE/ParE family toxin [Brevundimonas sp.]|jgi:toxin ParE1/3/4|uniref:type II toxin-antitoxin system RelE/ParE family toxin n=1 Tax=Brevundimonas sp. TaxID=1871086 RepID=UPI0037C06AA0